MSPARRWWWMGGYRWSRGRGTRDERLLVVVPCPSSLVALLNYIPVWTPPRNSRVSCTSLRPACGSGLGPRLAAPGAGQQVPEPPARRHAAGRPEGGHPAHYVCRGGSGGDVGQCVGTVG